MPASKSSGRPAGKPGAAQKAKQGSGAKSSAAAKAGAPPVKVAQTKAVPKAEEKLRVEVPTDHPAVEKKVRVSVDPDDLHATDVEMGHRTNGTMLVASEQQSRGANGWLSAPCDCVLTCFAALGEAIEAGVDQFVGLLLLPLGGALACATRGSPSACTLLFACIQGAIVIPALCMIRALCVIHAFCV